MSPIPLDARVCKCGHTAHWHGALVEGQLVPMGQGGCDSCDCAMMDEVRTDSLSSLRHALGQAEERERVLREALESAASEASLCDSPEKLEALTTRLLALAASPVQPEGNQSDA